ncbi:helix-turn-helix transcriptional regulator [Polaribacter sp. HaHaR_3_91]|uniref:helix-turn-helix transcriptional regulator n=1 Tax=Polaribacter sp. HaHaR_3_91 TaxID=2745561 RepID=UPI001C4F8B33|nr:AraC family transcriptional regulator [Polaribacter sp. HaHaR_3_91]QXP63454.1 helix-turn-helix transcriptional regulator [Polaribacter sp. HaHaR_3_91]
MKTTLKSSIFDKNILVKSFQKNFKTSNYTEKTTEINNNSIKGTQTEICINGLRIIIRDLKTKEYNIEVQHDFPLYKLQFEIEGHSHYVPLNSSQTEIFIPNAHYNLFYLPEVNGTLNYKTKRRKTLEILFTEQYLKDIIGTNFKQILHKIGTAISNKTAFLLWEKSKPISIELKSHIHQIVNCNYPDDLKKAYLEAKINELLIQLLAKTNENNYEEENSLLPIEDYKNILKISEYIHINLEKSLTITELAATIGVNTSKLKHDFKVIYATTIFKYITNIRMEKAKELILEKNYNVTEAAYKVGYKHAQHFTVAFKKIYGYLPSKLTDFKTSK